MASGNTSAEEQYYLHLASQLNLYVAPLILFGGTAGNIITVVVVLSRHFRHSPSSVLLLALAVVDTGVLFANLLDIWLGALLQTRPLSLHLTRGTWFGCKLSTFLTYYLSHASSWIIVLISGERVLWTYAPQRAATACTRRRLALALGAVLLVLFGINVHLFWTAQYTESWEPPTFALAHRCMLEDPLDIWSKVDPVIFSYVPFVIIFSCNIALIVALLRPSTLPDVESQRAKSNRSITAMLMTISLVFLATTSPLVITYQEMEAILSYCHGDPVAYALYIELIVNTVLVLLCYSNNALNFFLYCLSGAKFRRALKDICMGSPCCYGDAAHNRTLSEEEDDTSHISLETR